MGGGHQTRLCPDCARSNPAEGSADFPQARCHFSLNNSYEESNSSSALEPLFGSSSPSLHRFAAWPCFLSCCCTKLRCYDWNSSKSFSFRWCALGRGMFLDYEWRGRTLGGNRVCPRMQYGWQDKPSDAEETFATLCHLLNVFDLQTETV